MTLSLKSSTGINLAAFVYDTKTGEVLAWFKDDMKARSFSASQNRQNGKGYSDWGHTRAAIVWDEV